MRQRQWMPETGMPCGHRRRLMHRQVLVACWDWWQVTQTILVKEMSVQVCVSVPSVCLWISLSLSLSLSL